MARASDEFGVAYLMAQRLTSKTVARESLEQDPVEEVSEKRRTDTTSQVGEVSLKDHNPDTVPRRGFGMADYATQGEIVERIPEVVERRSRREAKSPRPQARIRPSGPRPF